MREKGRLNFLYVVMILLKSTNKLIQTLVILLIVVQGFVAPYSAEGHAVGIRLSGSGTASIDGVLSTAEWAGAGNVAFPLKLPGGATTTATLFIMNDTKNLYLAVLFGAIAERNSASFDLNRIASSMKRKSRMLLIFQS
jgi:hypothetical protein